MDVIIALVISLIGFRVCGIDFCTMHTLVTIALAIYERWMNHTNDKNTNR